MKSQVRYNTNIQVFLTQFLIYLYDNKEATYEEFAEVSDISPQTFSKDIKFFKNMIKDLKMNVTFFTDSYLDTTIDTNQFKTNNYVLQTLGEDKYHFEYKHLNEDQLILYSMTIVYLMLKQHKYVKMEKLDIMFPYFRRSILATMLEKLQSLLLDDITKNELNSYVLIEGEN